MSKDFGGVQKQVNDPSKPEQLGPSALHRLNILIVDDDEQSQRMMGFILRPVGHIVKFAFNGIEAVQIVKSGEFDLVLMDVQMPLMDGREATRQIREWENGKNRLPIIGLTATYDTEYGSCRQAGMDDIISKPFDTQQFYEAIAAYANPKGTAVIRTSTVANDQQSASSILDLQGAIKRFAGDQENYKMLLNEFIISLSNKFEELTNDCEANKWQSLADHAHNLKGLSANFGAMELSRKVLELEQYVNGDQYDQAKQKLGEINISIQNLQTEASAFFRNFSNDKDELLS